MSLLDNAKKEAQVEAPIAAEETPKKKHNNSEYQKRQREHQFKAACTIRDFLKSKVKDIPEDVQAELDFLCREKKQGSSAFGKPVIYQLFGDSPKKGAKITALEVFNSTGKGFSDMRGLMKKWNKDAETVKFEAESKSYVLVADIPAYNA